MSSSLLKQQLEAVAAAVVKYKSEAAGELNGWGGRRDQRSAFK